MAASAGFGLDQMMTKLKWVAGTIGHNSYKTEALIKTILLCDSLQGDPRLEAALGLSGELILGFERGWMQRDEITVPSTTTIRRHRFTVDAAQCLCMRDRIRGWIQQGIGFNGWMALDASPRLGKEWLFSECWLMTYQMQEAFLVAMDGIIELRENAKDCVIDLEKAKAFGKMLVQNSWHHVFVPVALGNGNANLGAKFVAVAHQFKIETPTWADCIALANAMISVTSDYGVEHLISDVVFNPKKLFEFWEDPAEVVDDSWDADATVNVPKQDEDCLFSFCKACKTPGIEHICSNALNQSTAAMKGYPTWLKQSKHVARFLRNKSYSDRLLFTCFEAGDARKRTATHAQMEEMLSAGVPVPYEKRFGTVVQFIEATKPMRGILQAFYRPQAFEGMGRGADSDSGEDTAESDGAVKCSIVSSAILSNDW